MAKTKTPSRRLLEARAYAAKSLLRETGDSQLTAEYMAELDEGQHDDAFVFEPRARRRRYVRTGCH